MAIAKIVLKLMLRSTEIRENVTSPSIVYFLYTMETDQSMNHPCLQMTTDMFMRSHNVIALQTQNGKFVFSCSYFTLQIAIIIIEHKHGKPPVK